MQYAHTGGFLALLAVLALLPWTAGATALPSERSEFGSVRAFGRCAPGKMGKLPTTLDEAMAELRRLLDARQTEVVRVSDSMEWHESLGRALRNCWGLWGDGPLGTWFRKQGIRHPDDMSAIVLESFRRRLNGVSIDLPEQIRKSQAYWKRKEDEYQKGTDSGNADYHIVPFREGEGWVSVHAVCALPSIDCPAQSELSSSTLRSTSQGDSRAVAVTQQCIPERELTSIAHLTQNPIRSRRNRFESLTFRRPRERLVVSTT
jgi:hypothetical protein